MPDVFISHVHEDDDGLGKLKDLLAGKNYSIRDSSINSAKPNNAHDPEYIKREYLAPHIRWASTLIVYITPKTCESQYVDWEIEFAAKNNKRIVGVWAHGEGGCQVPAALDDYADAVVGWNSGRIIDAIEGRVDGWVTQSGEVRPVREIKRYSCAA